MEILSLVVKNYFILFIVTKFLQLSKFSLNKLAKRALKPTIMVYIYDKILSLLFGLCTKGHY